MLPKDNINGVPGLWLGDLHIRRQDWMECPLPAGWCGQGEWSLDAPASLLFDEVGREAILFNRFARFAHDLLVVRQVVDG